MIFLKYKFVIILFNCIFYPKLINNILFDTKLIHYPNLDNFHVIKLCVNFIVETYSAGRKVIFISEQLQNDESHNNNNNNHNNNNNNNNNNLPEYLITNMNHVNKVILSVNNISNHVGLFCIIFNNKKSIFDIILPKIQLNDITKFVVIWDFQNKIDFRQIQNVMEEFWAHQIINVIAVVPFSVSKNIRIYTYFPFSPTRCGEVGPPVLINIWNSQRESFMRDNYLFSPDKKVFNLHKCPLKCVGVHRPPESSIRLTTDRTWKLSGTGIKTFEFVENHLNFTPIISLWKNTNRKKENQFKTQNQSISNPLVNTFDIGFGKFVRLLDSGDANTDFIGENRVDCFTWAVPHGTGTRPSLWTSYVIEFSPIAWLLIITNIPLVAFLLKWFVRYLNLETSELKTYYYSLFYIFSTFIGATVKVKEKSPLLKIFLTQWLLYSLVITAAYQAYRGSLMTIPQRDPEVNNNDGLLNTDLNLVGREEMFYVLNESSTSNKTFKKLIERFYLLPPGDFENTIERIVQKRDIAVFTSKRELIYYSQKRKISTNDSERIHIFSDCVLRSYFSTFMIRKGSPYSYPINSILSRLFEAGIYDYWDTGNIRDEKVHEIFIVKDTILTLREFYGAFIILFSGLFIALIAFIIEIFTYFLKESQDNVMYFPYTP